MATIKATFTLDRAAAAKLAETADRLGHSKSEVVREAILDYSERIERLSERERLRLLQVFDEVVPRIPPRPLAEVEAELTELRRARRHGGRRSAGAAARR